jgi:UDP-glucose 4-epimerase
MKVLVTGGAGFIGSYVVRELARQGHETLVWDYATDPLRDVRFLSESYGPTGIDAVIHLAGLLGTSELFDDFDEALDINVLGTQRVLELCWRQNARYVGITIPKVWANVYQATKACDRILATAYHESFGVPVSHVLAFNAYGPGQKHGPGHPQKIIPTFATLAYQGADLPVWGDGEQTVDLVSAADVANVLVDCMAYGDDGDYDAGTGVELTVNEVAECCITVAKSSSKIVHLPMRDGERPGTRLAASGLGWHRLPRRPRLDWDDLGDAIRSYAP